MEASPVTWTAEPRLVWRVSFGFVLPEPSESNAAAIVSPPMLVFGHIAVNVLAEYSSDRGTFALRLEAADANDNRAGLQCCFTLLRTLQKMQGFCFELPAVIASGVKATKKQVIN
jgi:hypothetical protein